LTWGRLLLPAASSFHSELRLVNLWGVLENEVGRGPLSEGSERRSTSVPEDFELVRAIKSTANLLLCPHNWVREVINPPIVLQFLLGFFPLLELILQGVIVVQRIGLLLPLHERAKFSNPSFGEIQVAKKFPKLLVHCLLRVDLSWGNPTKNRRMLVWVVILPRNELLGDSRSLGLAFTNQNGSSSKVPLSSRSCGHWTDKNGSETLSSRNGMRWNNQ
jgi:hypothetical protein